MHQPSLGDEVVVVCQAGGGGRVVVLFDGTAEDDTGVLVETGKGEVEDRTADVVEEDILREGEQSARRRDPAGDKSG